LHSAGLDLPEPVRQVPRQLPQELGGHQGKRDLDDADHMQQRLVMRPNKNHRNQYDHTRQGVIFLDLYDNYRANCHKSSVATAFQFNLTTYHRRAHEKAVTNAIRAYYRSREQANQVRFWGFNRLVLISVSSCSLPPPSAILRCVMLWIASLKPGHPPP
jgi:hypothetical protein